MYPYPFGIVIYPSTEGPALLELLLGLGAISRQNPYRLRRLLLGNGQIEFILSDKYLDLSSL